MKSVTLAEDGVAYFPDAVTARGTRHVQKLADIQEAGTHEAAVLFVVQRGDVKNVRPATHIDPKFSAALQQAATRGVQMLAMTTDVDLHGVTLGSRRIPVFFN
ncbi:sugar fermentation stimulation protein [Natribacillus halophilus]|uniref:Sugar fermentation stimulation protein n=1 Tax=Natribacillus halophilus TaxID=549003 RepID=A0A1G8Q212_9BACI|nr:sugar fermentation stimulation protein [Natribacillus halophilus]